MRSVLRYLLSVAATLTLLLPVARAAEVEVVLDPPILSLGESLMVTFSVNDRSAEPDFSPVAEKFDILRTSTRETLQIVNGRAEQTKVWRLTLVPRQAGTVEIPAIDFGAATSEVQRITVTPAREEKPGESDVFIEVSLEPEGEVYVQSQLLMTVRLYYDSSVRMSNATLSDPAASDGDLVVEKIAEERSQEQIGERVYKVFEQRYALFPQRSGRLTLDPIVFSADMRSYFERPAYRRVQSAGATLEVLPADPGGARPWLPALAITLDQQFPDAGGTTIEGRVGEPVTRSVTLSALGLTSAQLPPVEIPVPEGFKTYPDQPAFDQQVTPQGILGERVERLAMLPTAPGEYELPAVEVEWWDIQSDVPRTARLDPVTVRVLPAVGSGEVPPAVAGAAAGAAAGAGVPPSGTGPGAGAAGAEVRYDPGLWPWAALFLALGWAMTGGWWWRSARAPATQDGLASLHEDDDAKLATRLRELRAACEGGDLSAVRRALIAWARARWPRASVHDLIEVRQLAGADMTRILDQLDESRYADAPEGAAARPVAELAALAQLLTPGREKDSGGAGALEPLYR